MFLLFRLLIITTLLFIIELNYIVANYKSDGINSPIRQTDNLESGPKPDHFAHIASTDVSKLKLAILLDEQIDLNKDGSVQLSELVQWLQQRQLKYAQQDSDRQWSTFRKVQDGNLISLTWKDYSEKEYEHFKALLKQSIGLEQINEMKRSYNFYIQRDLRRWKAADLNQDGKLSQLEFRMFFHPEHYEQMHNIILEEKFELFDKDNDGKISFEEFATNSTPDELNHEPEKRDEWSKKQRSNFHSRLDLNHDNYLDKLELISWIMESELSEQSVKEAQQLMQVADNNHDHRLSKEEVLASYHEFVNSHATDFGELLQEPISLSHDEL